MIVAARRHPLSLAVHAVDDDGALCAARPAGDWRPTTRLPINCPRCLWRLERRYAFCERASSASSTVRHVRRLGATGLHYGGGCDTRALCSVWADWDLRGEVTRDAVRAADVCPVCAAAFGSVPTAPILR